MRRFGHTVSYVDLEVRMPKNHPLRLIRRIVNKVLAALDREFAELYAAEGSGRRRHCSNQIFQDRRVG
jgi:hypothetical protein